MPKFTAKAHAIQGLVKYHGLRDKRLRLPYHDSISVCAQALTTTTTIETSTELSNDSIEINNSTANEREAARILAVINLLRKLAKTKIHFKLKSSNNIAQAKGLGFSAAAFASIAFASNNVLDLKLDLEHLSEFARLGAGSASRSLVGGFSIWFAKRNGRSFARQLEGGKHLKLAMGIVPIASQIKTDMAHEESVNSPFFSARLREVKPILKRMQLAIQKGDLDQVCQMAETESLSLHAITMTGKTGLILMSPDTIRVIQRIRHLRSEEHIPVWYSLDTGPSVYINTHPEHLDSVYDDIKQNTRLSLLKSTVGGPAQQTHYHLF
ncbi:MAG: diphosphomevalonate decarboxylase [Candidatus Bathyarchaeia archaeon]